MNIEEVIATVKAGPNDITLYSGASSELLENFEQTVGFKLPDDLKFFYQFCNGFESAEDLFRIIPLDEVLETRSGDMSEYHVKANQFYLAEYLIYCDSWKIEIDLLYPNHYKIYAGPTISSEPEIMLTNSFADFLRRFLVGGVFNDGGLYKWREEIAG